MALPNPQDWVALNTMLHGIESKTLPAVFDCHDTVKQVDSVRSFWRQELRLGHHIEHRTYLADLCAVCLEVMRGRSLPATIRLFETRASSMPSILEKSGYLLVCRTDDDKTSFGQALTMYKHDLDIFVALAKELGTGGGVCDRLATTVYTEFANYIKELPVYVHDLPQFNDAIREIKAEIVSRAIAELVNLDRDHTNDLAEFWDIVRSGDFEGNECPSLGAHFAAKADALMRHVGHYVSDGEPDVELQGLSLPVYVLCWFPKLIDVIGKFDGIDRHKHSKARAACIVEVRKAVAAAHAYFEENAGCSAGGDSSSEVKKIVSLMEARVQHEIDLIIYGSKSAFHSATTDLLSWAEKPFFAEILELNDRLTGGETDLRVTAALLTQVHSWTATDGKTFPIKWKHISALKSDFETTSAVLGSAVESFEPYDKAQRIFATMTVAQLLQKEYTTAEQRSEVEKKARSNFEKQPNFPRILLTALSV